MSVVRGGGGRGVNNNEVQLYFYDAATNTYIPIKLDYSKARTPIISPEGLAAANARMAEGAKTDKALGVIVPLARIKPNKADWVQLGTIARKYPRENIIAVVNPTQDSRGVDVSGPGPDAEYINGIKMLQANGVMCVGHISVNADLRDIEEVKTEIDKWREWYPDVKGVYFDAKDFSNTVKADYDVVGYYKQLNDYAKSKGIQITIADITFNSVSAGDPVKSGDGFFKYTGIDIFVVYDMVGFPTDSHFAAYKTDWIRNYPRSKFAWAVTGVGDNDVLSCNNFVDRLTGIEKLAGYVYVYPELGIPNDERRFIDLNTISPYLETVLIQLDRQAAQEKIPFYKGVIPDSQVIREVPEIQITGTSRTPEAPEEIDVNFQKKDTLGITKIYPSLIGGSNIPTEWQSEYIKDKEQLTPVNLSRIEAWSSKGTKYLNVEATGYFRFNDKIKSKELLKIRTRTGGGKDSGYIGILSSNGIVHVKKQLDKNALSGMRAQTQATTQPLIDRWIGIKFVVYNYVSIGEPLDEGTKKGDMNAVQMEIFIDDNVTNQDGSLFVKGDWKPIMKMNDAGGWIVKDTRKAAGKKYKPQDKILLDAGGKEDTNAVFFEIPEHDKTEYRYLSVREIQKPRRD